MDAPPLALKQIAVVRSYRELKAVLRRRADEIDITREGIDQGGLQPGYAAKLLAPTEVKNFGPVSLGPVLSRLRVALVVVEDTTAAIETPKRKHKRPEVKV